MPNLITIETEMITLGQFLKLAEVIQSGGMAKWFLSEHEVFINQEPDNRRGTQTIPRRCCRDRRLRHISSCELETGDNTCTFKVWR